MKKLSLTFILCLFWVGWAWAHADIEDLPDSVAIISYRQVLYLNPDDLSTRNKLAMALFRTNKLEEAKKELQYILDRDSLNFDALDGLGVVLAKMGKHNEALQYLSKAVRINAQDVMVHVHLSVVYEKLKMRREAQAELNKAYSLASTKERERIEEERRLVVGR